MGNNKNTVVLTKSDKTKFAVSRMWYILKCEELTGDKRSAQQIVNEGDAFFDRDFIDDIYELAAKDMETSRRWVS